RTASDALDHGEVAIRIGHDIPGRSRPACLFVPLSSNETGRDVGCILIAGSAVTLSSDSVGNVVREFAAVANPSLSAAPVREIGQERIRANLEQLFRYDQMSATVHDLKNVLADLYRSKDSLEQLAKNPYLDATRLREELKSDLASFFRRLDTAFQEAASAS